MINDVFRIVNDVLVFMSLECHVIQYVSVHTFGVIYG